MTHKIQTRDPDPNTLRAQYI